MPALTTTAMLAADARFVERVTASIVFTALQVSGEGLNGHSEAQRTTRERLAQQVLDNPALAAQRFAWAVAANPTIATAYEVNNDAESVPDGDIAYVVTEVWDDLSGAAILREPVESPAP